MAQSPPSASSRASAPFAQRSCAAAIPNWPLRRNSLFLSQVPKWQQALPLGDGNSLAPRERSPPTQPFTQANPSLSTAALKNPRGSTPLVLLDSWISSRASQHSTIQG